MSGTIDHAKALNSLLRRLKGKYNPPEHAPRGLLEEFVFSFLLWDATHAKAEAALKRLLGSVVDANDLRVCRPPEIAALLGKQYPRAEERAQRLRAALNEIYVREYQVSLESLRPMGKREARQYLDSLEGTPPFVTARVVLLSLDGHAVPIDDRTLGKLIHVGVIESGMDPAKTEGILERHIKAGEAVRAHDLLQAWSEDSVDTPPARKPEPPPAPAPVIKDHKTAGGKDHKPAASARPASAPARKSASASKSRAPRR